MKTRMLRDIEVSEVGMGCMAFSHGYGQIPPESYSIAMAPRLPVPPEINTVCPAWGFISSKAWIAVSAVKGTEAASSSER